MIPKKEFFDMLEQEMQDTDNIKVSVTRAKGIVTLFWSITFESKTNLECFNECFEEIQWANMKIEQLAQKYKDIYVHHRTLKESDVIHYDKIYLTDKQPPVRKSWQTNSQSFGGYLQVKY